MRSQEVPRLGGGGAFSERRRVPAAAVEPLIRIRLKRAWRHPEFRRDAEHQLALLLADGPRAHEIPALAYDFALYCMRRSELRWHPRIITRQRVDNPEVLSARRAGQGLVVNFMHQALYDGLPASVQRHAGTIHTVVAPHYLRADDPLSHAPWRKQVVRIAEMGGPVVSAELGTDRLAELVASGATLAIASDLKGRTPVTFLGKKFISTSGAARIAHMTNSPVVVVTPHRGRDGYPTLHLSELLDPAEFESPLALLDQMLRLHEPAVLAWPEAVDRPVNLWQPAP